MIGVLVILIAIHIKQSNKAVNDEIDIEKPMIVFTSLTLKTK